jgi:hypothetical protein
MKKSMITAAFVAAATVFGLPSAALAVPGAEGNLVALTSSSSALIHQGATVQVTLGVGNNTNVSGIQGVVLNVVVAGDLYLPHRYSNCWYYTHGSTKGAWCLLDGTMQSAGVYVAQGFTVAAAVDASVEQVNGVTFQWVGRSSDDDSASMRALAVKGSGPGPAPVPGGSRRLVLAQSSELTAAAGPASATAAVNLVGPFRQPSAVATSLVPGGSAAIKPRAVPATAAQAMGASASAGAVGGSTIALLPAVGTPSAGGMVPGATAEPAGATAKTAAVVRSVGRSPKTNALSHLLLLVGGVASLVALGAAALLVFQRKKTSA